jgi:hypothetical protein
MNLMTRVLPLCLLMLFVNIRAHAQDDGFYFYCKPASSEIFVSIKADDKPESAAQYVKKRVDWQKLLQVGPQKNGWGDPLRSGSRISKHRCGALTLTFASGFVNANPQGELGALDFPLVEIRQGRKLLLPQTALEPCAVSVTRYGVFGECPRRWAESIDVASDEQGRRVRVKRVFSDEAYEDVERIDVYR